MVWVSSKGHYLCCCRGKYPVQYEGYQWEQLTGELKIDLKFAVRYIVSQIQLNCTKRAPLKTTIFAVVALTLPK